MSFGGRGILQDAGAETQAPPDSPQEVMRWLIIVLVALLYVHLFNAIAHAYFDSEQTLTLVDLWRRFFPAVSLRLEG